MVNAHHLDFTYNLLGVNKKSMIYNYKQAFIGIN